VGLCMSHRGALWGQVTAASQPHSPYDPITTTVPSHCHPITHIHMPQPYIPFHIPSCIHSPSYIHTLISIPYLYPHISSISSYIHIPSPVHPIPYPYPHVPRPIPISFPTSYIRIIPHPSQTHLPTYHPKSISSQIHLVSTSHINIPCHYSPNPISHPKSIPHSSHFPSQVHPISKSHPMYISFCHIPSRIQIPTRSPCILPPLPGGAHYIPAALSHKGQLLHLASPACLS